jgi:hypothetical protein
MLKGHQDESGTPKHAAKSRGKPGADGAFAVVEDPASAGSAIYCVSYFC